MGEIGDSRRSDASLVLPAVTIGVESVVVVVGVVVDDENDSASNAWILDWKDAEGIADVELEELSHRFKCKPHVIYIFVP